MSGDLAGKTVDLTIVTDEVLRRAVWCEVFLPAFSSAIVTSALNA
jgi:hypothetical protein